MVRSASLALGASLFQFLLPVAARAQCATEWLPGHGVPGVLGTIHDAVLRDPDGGGPAPARIVVGGDLILAGAAGSADVSEWDPATGQWSALGSGLSGTVHDLLLAPNGDVYAAGSLWLLAESRWCPVARWDGTAWSRIGDLDGSAEVLARLADGRIAIGGLLYDATGSAGAHLAVWDGNSISFPFGSPNGPIHDMLVRNGELIVRGMFTTIDSAVVPEFARWNGASWSAMPFGGGGFARDSMALLPNGDLVSLLHPLAVSAGGLGSDVGVWNGTTWTALPATGTNVSGLFVRGNGDLLVSAEVYEGGVYGSRAYRFTGAGWAQLPIDILHRPLAEDAGGALVVGIGAADTAAGIALWNGVEVSPMGTGTLGARSPSDWLGSVEAFATLPNGELVVGGAFTLLEGVPARNVARWNGSVWQPLGEGLDGRVLALAALPNGDLVAAGSFASAGGAPASQLARWDGAAWSPLANPIQGEVLALAVTPDGALYAAGSFYILPAPTTLGIVRWNGTTWSSVGGGVNGRVETMAVTADGDLVVGGSFVMVDGWPNGVLALRVARWDGQAWSAFGGTTPADNGVDGDVRDAHVLPNGDVVVAGNFLTAAGVATNGLARWDGSQWHAFAGWQGAGYAVASLPNGDLVASTVSTLKRWDGQTWTVLGAAGASGLQPIRDVRFHRDQLFVGGAFLAIDDQLSLLLAHLASTCPADIASAAAGCQGATLAATTLPWIDATLQTRATGLAAASLALAISGFQPVSPGVPLASLLPQGAAGCELHVAPEVLQLVACSADTASFELFVPRVPAIVGLEFRQQVLGFTLDAAGAITDVVATDSLRLQVGQF